jgi:membrane protease YdiL (CAAX protease family)
MPELTAARPPVRTEAISPLLESLWVSADVTVAVAAIAMGLPERWHTTLVGFVFLAATWALVWRHEDERVRRAGLTLGGLVLPGQLRAGALVRQAAQSMGWALGLTAIVAVPFFFGWRAWWGAHAAPSLPFSLTLRPLDVANEVAGQLFVIALPEEAFYRGYLQSRLDEAWTPRWRVLGATVGPGWLAASAIFALGHVATVHLPTRLAVFFPALLFGWLRARTGGIGASVCFHMLCNVYSQALGRGYGIY